jgi:hypothetical protein
MIGDTGNRIPVSKEINVNRKIIAVLTPMIAARVSGTAWTSDTSKNSGLVSRPLTAGNHAWSWNGSDKAGASAPGGACILSVRKRGPEDGVLSESVKFVKTKYHPKESPMPFPPKKRLSKENGGPAV